MDIFLNKDSCINRLLGEYEKHKSLIVAYDYDNTVYDFHKKGYTYDKVINLLRECKRLGFYLIVYSCSKESRYLEMKTYLNTNNIPFDSINENSPNIDFAHGKLYYNILLDDRAGLESAYIQLADTIKIINERGNV